MSEDDQASGENGAAGRLRDLPSVDAVCRTPEAQSLGAEVGAGRLTKLARSVIEHMRAEMRREKQSRGEVFDDGSSTPEQRRAFLLAEAARRLVRSERDDGARKMGRVINASGVILHTNLGRAPLAAEALGRLAEAAEGYCALEYDVNAGGRGRRGAAVEELLTEVTGAEAALVVNNCAAAAVLVLSTLARGGETIVSRGELVEIGGDFRVPDVMAQSGTRLVEVGTTNRTRASDYQNAINENTKLLLRVHPSNYRIVGFTAAPSLAELAEVAERANLPLYEDAGSGALVDLAAHGVAGEPVIGDSVANGADVVSFSGDKLLGGPQSGLIVGRRELIERLRREPLYRALRVDKLILSALEATLEIYARGDVFARVPALRALSATYSELERRVYALLERLPIAGAEESWLRAEIIPGSSAVGGGCAPTAELASPLIALTHRSLAAAALERRLRLSSRPPVVARVAADRVLLDLRTVAAGEEEQLRAALVDLNRPAF